MRAQAEAIAALFESMDVNNDGQVSFEEFKEAIRLNQGNQILVEGIVSPCRMEIGA